MGKVDYFPFRGMVCDNNYTGIPGATCTLTGSVNGTNHQTKSTSQGKDGWFDNSGDFWYLTDPGDPVEELSLYISHPSYISHPTNLLTGSPIQDGSPWDVGSPNQPFNNPSEVYWMVPVAPAPGGQAFEDLGLVIDQQPVEFAALVGAKATAWVGKWTNAQLYDQRPPVLVTIALETSKRGITKYTVAVDDSIFSQKFQKKGVHETTIRSVPFAWGTRHTGGFRRKGVLRSQRVPGIDLGRFVWLGSKPKPAQEKMLLAQPLGVLADALELGNGITLELYGIYSGKNLIDYAVRYRRVESKHEPSRAPHGFPGAADGRPLLDLMLERFLEIPK